MMLKVGNKVWYVCIYVKNDWSIVSNSCKKLTVALTNDERCVLDDLWLTRVKHERKDKYETDSVFDELRIHEKKDRSETMRDLFGDFSLYGILKDCTPYELEQRVNAEFSQFVQEKVAHYTKGQEIYINLFEDDKE